MITDAGHAFKPCASKAGQAGQELVVAAYCAALAPLEITAAEQRGWLLAVRAFAGKAGLQQQG